MSSVIECKASLALTVSWLYESSQYYGSKMYVGCSIDLIEVRLYTGIVRNDRWGIGKRSTLSNVNNDKNDVIATLAETIVNVS